MLLVILVFTQKVVNSQPEWVAGLLQNGWQLYSRTGGRFAPESTWIRKSRERLFFWSRNYKLFKKLLKEHTEVNLALLRSDKKRKKEEKEK